MQDLTRGNSRAGVSLTPLGLRRVRGEANRAEPLVMAPKRMPPAALLGCSPC